ncbi:unannotated protein [freshwater metagenome]|uniref:Unannotated protein n=1 Tax=freshwater metagenome TaxID=449393 RepID=A0A6J7MCM3_9ZZZZ
MPASKAPPRSALVKVVLRRLAVERSASVSVAPVRLTLFRFVPVSTASVRSTPLRSVPEKLALLISAPTKLTPLNAVSLAPLKSTGPSFNPARFGASLLNESSATEIMFATTAVAQVEALLAPERAAAASSERPALASESALQSALVPASTKSLRLNGATGRLERSAPGPTR